MVGNFIKEQRESLGISQGDLAEALGAKSRQTISNIERGVKPLPNKFIVPLSKALDVPAEALVQIMVEEFQESCLEIVQDELAPKNEWGAAHSRFRKLGLKT